MDARLVAWARAVKARGSSTGRVPQLWLFTDTARLGDPRAAVARLPRGLAGVVLRDDGLAGRERLAHDLARLCRARRLRLSVAGDWRLAAAVRAGVHLRAGRRAATMPRWLPVLTSSAHDAADLRRARRAGAQVGFLSPAFATRSHPGAMPLGPARWGLAVRRGGGVAGALGGISGATIGRISLTTCIAIGAIDGLR